MNGSFCVIIYPVPIEKQQTHPRKVDLLSFIEMVVSSHSQHKIMITIQVEIYNNFTQDYYDSVIFSLQLHQLSCSCGHYSCLTIHGYYKRSVITPLDKVSLRIVRVKCSVCGKTHALLLSSIVPYSQVSLLDHQQVASEIESGGSPKHLAYSVPHISESTVKSILKKFRHYWKERLRAESIKLEPLPVLLKKCFAVYETQFMQIRGTFNKLFPIPTYSCKWSYGQNPASADTLFLL